jgi:hypothetical protein
VPSAETISRAPSILHFGAYEGHRFFVSGIVHDEKPLPDAAAKTLKTPTGVGARFQVSRLVAYDLPYFTITIVTTTAEHTRRRYRNSSTASAPAVSLAVRVPGDRQRPFLHIRSAL